jgi:hypothetical protein
MTPHDHELPEDHASLLLLAADVQVAASAVLLPTALPEQRAIDISDEATALVGEPTVGLSTHGR